MKILITLLCFVTLSGCATKVHLITQGYEAATIERISGQLRDKGFDVEQSSIGIPSHYPSSVIAIHPAHQSATDLTTIQSLLKLNELDQAMILRFGQNKHYYNQGHVGLYLRHPDIDPSVTMPPYVESVACKTGYATMAFKADNTMLLETETHTNGQYILHTTTGKWFFDGSILTVTTNNNETAQFSQSNINRETPLGPKPALLYSPTTKNHLSDPLKCHFEVVFID